MKRITVEMVRLWEPCYDPTDVVPEDWTGTALDVLNLPISADDRLWVVLHEEILSEATLREFARWCALQVIHLWDAPDVVREYLETGDETLRVVAWDAARASRDVADAVWNATRAAACAASRDASRAAAQDASWAATDAARAAADAAWDTSQAVAWDASRDDSRDEQVEKLKEMIAK